MQPEQVRELADELDLCGAASPIEVKAGHGLAELWRLPRQPGPDTLLRIFPPGSTPMNAEREAAAQRLAITNGVSAPMVLTCAVVAGRPTLAMEWIEAPTVSRLLLTGHDPHRLGRRCGRQLAGVHQIRAAEVVSSAPVIVERDWVGWAGPRAEALRGPIGSTPGLSDRRLLHLDFHPDNLLLNGDDVVVLDWANARVGPISADLARSASILQLIEHHPDLGELGREVVAGYRAGFAVGYGEIAGEDAHTPVPRSVRAWAAAVGLADLVDADWVPATVRDRFEVAYRQGLG